MKKIEYDKDTPMYGEIQTKAKKFCKKYNELDYDSLELQKLLKNNLKHFGDNSRINQPFYCDMAVNISIGDNVFINYNCTMLDMGDIEIGNNVLIGPNVVISAATHSISAKQRLNGQGYSLPVKINDDCWIGANVTIMPGVELGKGTIVGAGAVVTKSSGEYEIIAGVPARVIGKSNE